MLRSLLSLDYKIRAVDGDIGSVHDWYFDDQSWKVRYLVVDTGGFLMRKVLLSTASLGEPQWTERVFPVKHTREEVKNSPNIDTEKPVSRQHERDLHTYYEWMPYWGGPVGAPVMHPIPLSVEEPQEKPDENTEEENHLRSFREVSSYAVRAVDGKVGQVEDFIVDDSEWVIKMLVADTGSWLRGRRVLLATGSVEDISYPEKSVAVNLRRETVENSPEFDPAEPVNEELELRLYDYYGRPKQL